MDKVGFLTKTNLIILGLIWGLFVIIIYLRKDTLYDDASNIVTIFAAFLLSQEYYIQIIEVINVMKNL